MSDPECSVPDMGDIFFDTATTINGFIADEHNSLQWLFDVPQEQGSSGSDDEWEHSPIGSASVIVKGSTTYEWVLDEENIRENPGRWTEIFGEKPVYVFSTRELWVPPGSGVRIVSGPVRDRLGEIRAAAGEGNIWLVGGGDLVGQFFDADAVDKLMFSVAPVFLDAGAPLLPRRIESDRLRLDNVRRDGQFARLEYKVLRH